MTKRILHVVTNVAHYADPTQPTGLWLSELTHAYEIFAARGYQQRLVSPRGGESPLEPRALGWPHADASASIVSSVCHGYCGLLNTRLDDGRLLVAGRRLTGYSWIEEVLAGVARKVPYNVEEEMKRRGALYERSLLPFTSKVVVDGRLVTGQNPQSAKATAEQVAALLG